MGDDDFQHENGKLSIVLVCVGSVAFVLIIYHCLTMRWCHPHGDSHGQGAQEAQQQHSFRQEMLEIEASLENSTAQLIPAHKYQKGVGLVDDDGMCAVCLSQFEDGEELRTLPQCLHSYHAPCIDMWLYSHSSCPMCRTDATPSPQTFHHQSDSGSGPPGSDSVHLDSAMGSPSLQHLFQPPDESNTRTQVKANIERPGL
ncbi:RING-H2 finger protein ATL52-like [Durio zibethinus]|uniref:RING-H2 finger protein ATL52-like n=1 Tax=Durio zibethinus TaxID=66656 RepID=A0A6P5Z5G1_DURZI|nr:RING-H2 finger protein ATL52-like [Durio zibethinus]